MFERFTTGARTAVINAQVEARSLGHDRIGTEHLLLALLADPQTRLAQRLRAAGLDHDKARRALDRPPNPGPDPTAADTEALKAIGIDLEAVHRAIEESFGPDALQLAALETTPRRRSRPRLFGGSHIPLGGTAKKALQLSLREAIHLGSGFIGPEHLLLGLLRGGDNTAVRILSGVGADLAALRTELETDLRRDAA